MTALPRAIHETELKPRNPFDNFTGSIKCSEELSRSQLHGFETYETYT